MTYYANMMVLVLYIYKIRNGVVWVHTCIRTCGVLFCLMMLYMCSAGEKTFPLTWEVIEALEMYDTLVVSLTSDGAITASTTYANNNRKESPKFFPTKQLTPFRENEEVFIFCDAPHLLKTSRIASATHLLNSKVLSTIQIWRIGGKLLLWWW